MSTTDFHRGRTAELKRRALEMQHKKDAWKKYESNLRRARSGYSELELDDL